MTSGRRTNIAELSDIFRGGGTVVAQTDLLERGCVGLPPRVTDCQVIERAQKFADVGVSTLVTTPVGDDPGGWFESTFGPAIDELPGWLYDYSG